MTLAIALTGTPSLAGGGCPHMKDSMQQGMMSDCPAHQQDDTGNCCDNCPAQACHAQQIFLHAAISSPSARLSAVLPEAVPSACLSYTPELSTPPPRA